MRGNELFSRALALIYPENAPSAGLSCPMARACAPAALRLPRADCRVLLGALPNGRDFSALLLSTGTRCARRWGGSNSTRTPNTPFPLRRR